MQYSTKQQNELIQYIVVDLFSGAGGTSTGIERAMVDNEKVAGTETDKKKFIGNAVHTIVPQRWYEAMAMNNLRKKEAV